MVKETVMIDQIKNFCNIEENPLFTAVFNEITDRIDNENDFVSRMDDITNHGCSACGILIYYDDVEEFYEKYKIQINEFLSEILAEQGLTMLADILGEHIDFTEDPLYLDATSKSWIIWLVVEEITRRFVHELELED